MLRNLTKTCSRVCEAYREVTAIPRRNAGHSKWQNIRHIKAAKDAERGTLFHKISRQMRVAVQEGGSANPKSNPKLQNALEQARRANMSNASVQSILKSCVQDKSNSKAHMLEIKGPGGCLILCEVFTSNLHHLKQNIMTILRKHNSKYTDGSGLHVFYQKGIVEAEVLPEFQGKTEEEILEASTDHAIECGAEDVEVLDGALQFVCAPTAVNKVANSLEELKYKVNSASVEFIPQFTQSLSEKDLELCTRLYDKLEGLPEVIRLSSNIE